MELKRYQFPFGLTLDDDGQDKHVRLADPDDIIAALEDHGEETSPSEVLHELTRQEMDKFPSMNYRDALSRVQDRNPRLVALYASESGGRVRVYNHSEGEGPGDNPSAKLDKKARVLVASGVCKDYSEGVRRAMSDDPALAYKWAGYTTAGRDG